MLTLAAIIDVAGHVGLPVLFLLIAGESLGIPLPGETALITGGVLASRGDLSIEAVIVVAAAAAVLGDNVGYVLGRRFGRRLFTMDGPLKDHRAKVIEVGEPFFDRHGPKAVFLGRWLSGLRITAAWMAGISKMHWATFGFWNLLGGVLWSVSYGLLAYYLGHKVLDYLSKVGILGAVIVVAALAGVLIYRRRQAEDRTEDEASRAVR